MKRNRGFTLIELLVVAAIIALLVAIVIPAVGRARDRTNLVLCQGHLRSLVADMLLYAHANQGFLPVDQKIDNPHTELIETLKKANIMVDPRIYYCPSMADQALVFSYENFAAGNIDYFYFSCREATTNPDVSTFLRWGKEVIWPRRLRDSMDPETWVLSDIWLSSQPTAHPYYKKGVNYAVLSGEVRMVSESPRQEFQ